MVRGFLSLAMSTEATSPLPRAVRRMLLGSFLFLLLAAVAGLGIAWRTGEGTSLVANTFDVMRLTRMTYISLQNAEAGQRGYLLTGDRQFAEPYFEARQQLPDQIQVLGARLDDPNHLEQLDALSQLIASRLLLLEEGIEHLAQGRPAQAADVVRLRRGQALMEEAKAGFDNFLSEQFTLLTRRQARLQTLVHGQAGILGFAMLMAIALAALAFRANRHFVSELVNAQAELEAEMKSRKETEVTLRQAQKMEAVGHLSGGIAHDFNNILTVVMGNLDTIKRRIATPSETHSAAQLAETLSKPVAMALQGTRSAAQLTQRLLAFSRRQALNPVPLDLNRLVQGLSDLLARTVGETIETETVLAGGLWTTFADANQLENVLVNLVVNARDAMPDGGKITIETANAYLDDAYARRFGDVDAGQYVLLSVSDSGTGIPPEVIDRVFEPFFTTKDEGKGSGLGLAMVHGFVKQSKGHVRVYSEPGHGTTVKVYLPRVKREAEPQAVPAGAIPSVEVPRSSGGEVILLVEDNAGVRDYAVSVLAELGYKVIHASDAARALALFENNPSIQLLFTDVVLPGGMSGRDLARAIGSLRPDLPVLFTTGYTRNAIVHNGTLDADVQLLNKPYTQQDLARKIRQLLDQDTAQGPDGVASPGSFDH